MTQPPVVVSLGSSRGVAEVSLFRLYTLRVCYLIVTVGLGVAMWPSVLRHTSEFALRAGVQMSLLAGLGLTAALGLRYPVKMVPLLLFELIWKTVYLVGFALPLWRAHRIDTATAADIASCLLVVIFVPLIPWGFVIREYVMGKGERWR